MANCLSSGEKILPRVHRTRCYDVRNSDAFYTGCYPLTGACRCDVGSTGFQIYKDEGCKQDAERHLRTQCLSLETHQCNSFEYSVDEEHSQKY